VAPATHRSLTGPVDALAAELDDRPRL